MSRLPPQFDEPVYREAASVAQNFLNDKGAYLRYRKRLDALNLQATLEIERDKAVKRLEDARAFFTTEIEEKDKAIQAKNKAIESKDKAIEAKDRLITELQEKLRNQNS